MDAFQTVNFITAADVPIAGAGAYAPSNQVAWISDGTPQVPKGNSPRSEYIAGGLRDRFTPVPLALAEPIDAVLYQYGDRLWDVMLSDPKVDSSVNTVKESILADGIKLQPARQAVEEEVAPDGDDPAAKPSDPDPDPDVELAEEIAEACERSLRGLDDPIELTAWQLLDGIVYGCKLAEVTYAVGGPGPDLGLPTMRCLKVKPRWAWAFALDFYLNCMGILCTSPGRGTLFVGRQKVVIFSWMPRDGDPRGTPGLRAAYNGWNLKIQVWPQYYDYLTTYACPSTVGTTAEGAPDVYPRNPSTGAVDETAPPVSAQQAMQQDLALFRGGTSIAVPFGAKVENIEVYGEGEAFRGALEECNQEIVSAILQTTRATLESRHGSRADSQTAQDVVGLLSRIGKQLLANCLRNDLLRPFVRERWGDDAARRLTPEVVLGDLEHQDTAAMANALAKLYESGAVDPSQLPAFMRWLGLPEPSREAVLRLIKARAAQDAPPEPRAAPGAPGAPGGKPAPAKPKPAA